MSTQRRKDIKGHIEAVLFHMDGAIEMARIEDNEERGDLNNYNIWSGILFDLVYGRQKLMRTMSEIEDQIGENSVLDKIHYAMDNKKLLRLVYMDSKGITSERTIKAISLGVIRHHDTLTAWCHEKNAMRHFRLSRIVSLTYDGSGPTNGAFTYTGEQIRASFVQAGRRPRRAVSLD